MQGEELFGYKISQGEGSLCYFVRRTRLHEDSL